VSDIGLGCSANSDRYSYFPQEEGIKANLVDPARGHCYRGSTKPCESNAARHGVLLSNTWITYPWDGHKPGKLGIIPDRSGRLECIQTESSGTQGWVCGLSGSSGCNVPTSLLRVRVVRARARRWILRHESRPYGVQQARKLYNAGNRDKGTSSADIKCRLS
jgi:hypothetical protein